MAAFPSVFHRWIFLVLEYRRFPIGFQDFIRSLYFCNAAYFSDGGSLIFLFWMFSGVLQGCPASAFLFDCILDPFLEAFSEVIYQYSASKQCNPTHIGILRCCADDVGAALLSLTGLKYLAPIFDLAELLAGLILKPVKCVIVPTSCRFSQDVVDKIRTWLMRTIPKWKDFNILPHSKYLGIVMGPEAKDAQWKKPINEFVNRAQAIGSVHAPISISTYLYNISSVSVLCMFHKYVVSQRSSSKLSVLPSTGFGILLPMPLQLHLT